MAFEVAIPRLGWSMEEGVFAGWLKQPGDAVRPGEPLFMLEGEKATQDVEAVDGGILHLAPDAPAVGQTVPVGRVIARLCAEDEPPAWPDARAGTAPRDRAAEAQAAGPVAAAVGADSGPPAAESGGGGWPRTSPRARRAARALGIDLAGVAGGGSTGRVRERDVLVAAEAGSPQAAPAGDQPAVAISPTRRTIAAQMVRSRQETVPVTLTRWADATRLLAARAAGKAAAGPEAATINDMLLKVLADALAVQPLLAARWASTHLVLPGGRIDIGLAVDAPDGLVVPVIRDVAATPLDGVARQTRTLIERARAGRLTAADMQGGVFTLTSLGGYGVEFFTPVINHPQAAILGVGAIRLQPVPPPEGREGFLLQHQLPLSLTFDHRIVDGAPAARFLADLAARIGGLGK